MIWVWIIARSLELNVLKSAVAIRIYPGRALAARAVEEGVLSLKDDLFPRFYLAPGLDRIVPSADIMDTM